MTYNPGPKLNLNARMGFLPSWERSLGILPSVDGSDVNPLSQGRVWDSFVDSHSIGATTILSQSFVVDGSFGYTKHNVHVFPPVDTCYGDVFGIPNSCQPPYSLDTNVPDMTGAGYVLNGTSPIRDYVDPQWQMVANAGWTKGSHNVKFGIDYIILFQDHYETQAQAFGFNGGVTTVYGGAAANDFNRFASFLLGMPSSRTAQVMTPLLGGDASGASHPSTGTPNEFRPNTLRNNNVGTYIRDQWNITPKITASVGLRWEYYSLPRRADHGIEVYDFNANRLLICDVGPNDANCGIAVEKNLFTPRLGIAYRPMEDFVIRAGYSRNPQSNNPGRQQMVPSQSFPQTIVINEAAPNNLTAVGSLSQGATIVQPANQSSGVLTLPPGAGVNTYKDEFVRGRISSWNVSAQKALGTRMSATFAYVANRQNGMLRNRNVNYGTLGGGAASQPFFPLGINSAMNIFTADGKVKYDSFQLSLNRRLSDGFQFTTAYTFAKTTDWWRTSIPIPRVPRSQPWRDGRSAPVQRVADVRVALRQRQEVAQRRRSGVEDRGRLAGQHVLQRCVRHTHHRDVQRQRAERAGHHHAVCRQGQGRGRRDLWRRGHQRPVFRRECIPIGDAGTIRQLRPGRVEGTDGAERGYEPVPRVSYRPEQDAPGAGGSIQCLEHAPLQQPEHQHLRTSRSTPMAASGR